MRVRGRALPRSARGEVRHWKIPGLSNIRIGGSVGKAFEDVKAKARDTKVLGLPVSAIGSYAAGGLPGVIEDASQKNGGNLGATAKEVGQDIVQGAKNTPLALAGSKLLPGDSVTNAGGTAGGNVPGTPPDPSSVNPLDPATEAAIAATPEGKSLLDQFKAGLAPLSSLLDFAKKYAPVAVEVLAAKAAHDRQAQSDKYAQQGLDLAKEHYAQNAPLRDAGRSGMLSAGAYKPDLTKLNSLAGSGYSGPGSTLPMATQRQQPGTLPIAAGPPTPTPTPSGGGPRMPMPGQFSPLLQGPANQLPIAQDVAQMRGRQPGPDTPSGPVQAGLPSRVADAAAIRPYMHGGDPSQAGTLPIAGMPPIPNLTRKPTLPFAQPAQ